MTNEPSPDTRAILLLTAPLIGGRGADQPSVKPLGAVEYRRLARLLWESKRRRPADLLGSDARKVLNECGTRLDSKRLERLLGRRLLLDEAVERWRERDIWVLSGADEDAGYPRRRLKRLGEEMPPVLYGSGDAGILSNGGLAVVGSRNVREALIEYTENVGRLVAVAGHGLVSGGARGVDRAAMRGALDSGGRVVGVLADGLEKVLPEHRKALKDGRLVLVSPYDPAARFHVGQAMRRNKLVYALSDAALVVDSDYGKGGTWDGAIEQLDKLKLVPVYVRARGATGRGLEGLRERGAIPWPEPATPDDLKGILGAAPGVEGGGYRARAVRIESCEGKAVNGLEDWKTLIKPKHWKRGRSVCSLAEFIIDRNGAPALQERVASVLGEPIVFDKGVPQHEVCFDEYRNGRVHDLGLFGKTDSGKSLFVGVEAKVDEPFGDFVSEAWAAADKERKRGKITRKPERIRKLCARFGPGITEESRDVRYQLLHGVAGTVDAGADLSVFYVIVFRTGLYDAEKGKKNHEDYRRFVERAGGERIRTGDDGVEAHVLTVGGKRLHAIHEYVNLDRGR